jgi:hypothetical protein
MEPRLEVLAARFVDVAKADSRVVGVALVGSNAAGTADEHSDLDLFIVAEDDSFEDFVSGRDAFLAAVGKPLFIESWDRRDRWFFVFEGGGDGDLAVVPASAVGEAFNAPFAPLLDKRGVFEGVEVVGPAEREPGAAQRAAMQRRIIGFWHDYAHFVTAWSRGQWWWAQGQLEVLRGMCTSLLRLAADASDGEGGDEPYWKVELTLPEEQLARLQPTLNTFEPGSMLSAGRAIAVLYRELASQLAETHGLEYPSALEALVLSRLDDGPEG